MNDADFDDSVNVDRGGSSITIETNAVTLLGVHGYIALALKHPQVNPSSPSALLAAKFAREILQALIDAELFTDNGLLRIANDIDTRLLPESLQALKTTNGGVA